MAIDAFSTDSATSRAYKLLNSSKNFILPEFFEQLYRKFEQVDLLLSFYKTKITPPFFSNIQSSLRQSSRASLEIDDLLYMTGIFQGCYFLEWEKNETKNQPEIYLDFPQDENEAPLCASMKPGSRPYLEARKRKMKGIIFALVKQKHESFLATLDPPVKNYDYNGQGFWHHLFDLHNCSPADIKAIGVLPPRPQDAQKQHSKSVKEFLATKNTFTTNNTTNNINISINIQSENMGMPQTPMSAPNKFPNTTSLANNISVLMGGIDKNSKANSLSLCTPDKIPFFDSQKSTIKSSPDSSIVSICNQLNDIIQTQNPNFSTPFLVDKMQLRDIAERLVMYYSTRKVSNMFFESVVQYLCKFGHASKDMVEKSIGHLVVSAPGWLQIIDNVEGVFLRVNRKYDWTTVLKMIN